MARTAHAAFAGVDNSSVQTGHDVGLVGASLTVRVRERILSKRYGLSSLDHSAEGLLVQPRITSVTAGLITLSMVVFGQVCALRTLVTASQPSAAEFSVEAEADAHAGTCTSEACGGESGERDGPCPSGASMCCSTWAPPNSRLSLSPPSSLRLALNEAWLVLASVTVVEDGAQGVALFQLARPPGSSSDLLLTSSLSRRGPPALS